MRAKRIAYNSITQFLNISVQVIAGLILPRLILSYFGSVYFGAVTSVTQFLGYITLLTAGVGGVTMAALYKPLAEYDIDRISGIIRATEIFMRKVALIFIGILIAIAALYPLIVSDDFEWLFVFTLTLILGCGTIISHFFGAAYSLLIQADQRGYTISAVKTCTILLNTAAAAILILNGYEIRVVYLASTLIFAIDPLFIFWYTRHRYKLDRSVQPDNTALKQRWDAFAHQIIGFVSKNAPVVILTVFVGLLEVSVFAVYIMILNKITQIITSLAGSGTGAAIGNMLAKGEDKTAQKALRLFELLSNSFAVLLVACTSVLIVPFISVYTLGVDDVNYYKPIFAIIACVATLFNILSNPYLQVIYSAGHFRQTRNIALIEVGINIIISVISVQLLGLIGVVIGMLIAVVFRTVMFSRYVSQHIIKRSMWVFIRRTLVSILISGVIFIVAQFLPEMAETTYIAWILYALQVFGIAVGVTTVLTVLFYRDEVQMLWEKVRSMVRG